MTRKLTLTTVLAMAALVLAVPAFGSPDTDELISVGLGQQYAPDALERAVAANQLGQSSTPRYSDSATAAMTVDKHSLSVSRYSDSATASIEHAVLAREQAQREAALQYADYSDSVDGALWAGTTPDVSPPVAETSATGSGSEIEWPQIGFGLGLGILLGFGIFLAMRFIRVRPLAH
jgi:hypothetical protein